MKWNSVSAFSETVLLLVTLATTPTNLLHSPREIIEKHARTLSRHLSFVVAQALFNRFPPNSLSLLESRACEFRSDVDQCWASRSLFRPRHDSLNAMTRCCTQSAPRDAIERTCCIDRLAKARSRVLACSALSRISAAVGIVLRPFLSALTSLLEISFLFFALFFLSF